jgi:hypothetical protein
VRTQRQKGIALITALMVLILVSALAVGMCWMVMTDQRLGGNNQFRETAFYGAEAGMEKLTADVGNQFATNGSLSTANMIAITGTPPQIPGIQYLNASGASTYQILCGTPLVSPCVPVSQNATMLPPSPYAGMQGLITPFTLEVAAQSISSGAEVKLQRQVQVVAIPVFQFGIYSASDLSYFAGPPFDFGGRVHTNGNLWLAANTGPLYLADKVTVVGQVVRTNLENGFGITAGGAYSGVVSIATTPNPATLPPGPAYSNAQWSPLALTEGSVTSANPIDITNVGTAPANGAWPGVTPRYNGQLANGVPTLSLTSTALGGISTPISLIRRPVPGETAAEFNEQYFSEATLRILVDDYPAGVTPGIGTACHGADMMSENSVTTATDPVDLALLAVGPFPAWDNGASNVPAIRIPLPTSGAGAAYAPANGYWIQTGKPMITGCMKIEAQNLAGTWTDITSQILALGFTGRNINPTGTPFVAPPGLPPLTGNIAQGPTTNPNVTSKITCIDPSPQAVIRIERLRDNPSIASPGGGCGNTALVGSTFGTDYWPMALFDAREGTLRTVNTPTQVTAQGVMYYIELDAGNLATWFKNNQALFAGGLNNNTGGYTVYFSDRRGEQTDPSTGTKTGSLGFEDIVNAGTTGCPDNAIEQGEDLEGDGLLRTYGGAETIPLYPLATGTNNWTITPLWTGTNMAASGATKVLQANSVCPAPVTQAPVSATNWPGLMYVNAQEARENPPVFFRRALKLVDGQTLNLGNACGPVACGLTVVSENPVYIQGDYNAPADGSFTGNSVAASVAGDAITLLSDNWNDASSFAFPYSTGSNAIDREAVQTAYRTALIAGKGIPFVQPAGEAQDFGTDGGVHNFLKFLETWSGVDCYYEGSLVSFYYNRQGVGVYKNSGAVYSPPSRHYFFDQNFTLGPQFLPPRTPSLRSINTIGFSQELLPTQ